VEIQRMAFGDGTIRYLDEGIALDVHAKVSSTAPDATPGDAQGMPPCKNTASNSPSAELPQGARDGRRQGRCRAVPDRQQHCLSCAGARRAGQEQGQHRWHPDGPALAVRHRSAAEPGRRQHGRPVSADGRAAAGNAGLRHQGPLAGQEGWRRLELDLSRLQGHGGPERPGRHPAIPAAPAPSPAARRSDVAATAPGRPGPHHRRRQQCAETGARQGARAARQ
jgi:hypothetical protein